MALVVQRTTKEIILETYGLTDERFEKGEKDLTASFRSYWSGDMKADWKPFFKYLDKIDSSFATYHQFGADKCGVRNMAKFCELLDIDFSCLQEELEKYPYGSDKWNEVQIEGGDVFRGYNIASRDRQIVANFASGNFVNGYFHYMTITGEGEAVLRAYQIFLEERDSKCDTCWGGPW